MKKSWLIISLVNFLIAAVMGLLLRLSSVFPVHFNYHYMLHGHSHTALLGWLYMIIYSLFAHYFIPPEKKTKTYNTLFGLTQLTVIGMMVSFPLQGYALLSIVFSTLHILLSYFFAYRIWNDQATAGIIRLFVNTALLFMLLSTLGAWSLGILQGIVGKSHSLYSSAIQFFLHFQFNGWFTGAVLAILLHLLFGKEPYSNLKKLKKFHLVWVISVVVTFSLPLSWFYNYDILKWVNSIGVLLQLWSFILLMKVIRPIFTNKIKTILPPGFLWLALISFGLKIIMQLLTMLPCFALAHSIRNITIGYIHLLMLGSITSLIMVFIAKSGSINARHKMWRYGCLIFFTGFIITELILFGQGFCSLFQISPSLNYPQILLIASMLLPLGLTGIIHAAFSRK